jgi:molecular chaperone GrpE
MYQEEDRDGAEHGQDMQSRLEPSRQQAEEYRDKYLRVLAESENSRKRMERLCEDRMWQEKKRLMLHLLVLADQLEEALKYASPKDPVATGVRLTHQQLQKALKEEGVQPLQSVGQIFDPSVHEAVELAVSPGQENEVILEFTRGYTLDGKLLRPARVQIGRNHEGRAAS